MVGGQNFKKGDFKPMQKYMWTFLGAPKQGFGPRTLRLRGQRDSPSGDAELFSHLYLEKFEFSEKEDKTVVLLI